MAIVASIATSDSFSNIKVDKDQINIINKSINKKFIDLNKSILDSNFTEKILNEFTKALKEFYDEHFVFSTQDKEADFGMIIVVNGLMYEHDAGVMSMTRFATNHLSVGSGSEYAYGSLHSTEAWSDGKKRVRIAVDAATKYSTSCMGPIDVVEVLHTK